MRLPSTGRLRAVLVAAVLLLPAAAGAQPYGAWALFNPGATGYLEIPHSAALNPTAGFTFEAWVSISNNASGQDCRSIAGKDYAAAWWVGECNLGGQPTLRSYLRGLGSNREAGIVPRGVWTHVAVTFDGSRRRHYIDGELVGEWSETAPLATSTAPLRIGSDVHWDYKPTGQIDEVRLWNVARSLAQIRAAINVVAHAPQAGLVAVWPLDSNVADPVGGHDGTLVGSGVVPWTFPAILDCGASTASHLCLDDHFLVSGEWRTNPAPGTPVDGDAHVAISSADSGVLWFFAPTNWEVMVKVIDGCGLNHRFWFFSAATTNVFYRLTVTDVRAGASKTYFNYPGPPAPAVTDTAAFATCP